MNETKRLKTLRDLRDTLNQLPEPALDSELIVQTPAFENIIWPCVSLENCPHGMYTTDYEWFHPGDDEYVSEELIDENPNLSQIIPPGGYLIHAEAFDVPNPPTYKEHKQ